MTTDGPSWQDLIDMVADAIKNVDENSKRESTNLRTDITLLRTELNAARDDSMLVRSEMNALRVDMSNMRGKLERDMVVSDSKQCSDIELIKQEAKLLGDRKAQLTGIVMTTVTAITAAVLKFFGLI